MRAVSSVQAAPERRCSWTSASTRLGADQRGVAGQHDDVAVLGVEAEVVVGQAGEPDGHRVAGAALLALLDELERHRARVLLQGLDHHLGAVPDDDHGPVGLVEGHGIEHVPDERPAAQHVQRLGTGRAHARALAGGQDDGGERSHDQCVPQRVRTEPAFIPLL